MTEPESDAARGVALSVTRVVATFLAAAFVVLAGVGVVLAIAQRRAATAEAIRDARTVTNLEAVDVVGPALTDAALDPGPAQDALNQVVHDRVLGTQIVRVKIWDASGTIRYSDDLKLIGSRFPLASDERRALLTGRTAAEVTNLSAAENRDERRFGKLLQVYLGVRTSSGQRLLFETYQPYSTVAVASHRMWATSLKVLAGGLVLLYLLQAPLAYRMARRLKISQEERERLLVASLAASDRERVRIAADLHDGVVQGLAGTSFALSAAATRSADTDPPAAEAMRNAATDLRRWVRELRSLVVTITPPALHAQGLAASLADLAAVLEGRGIQVVVAAAPEDCEGIAESAEVLLYRAAQEAVRNVVRHADCTQVTISVTRPGDRLELFVADNGKGFDAAAAAPRRRGSVGLELLRSVAHSQDGTLTVASEPGRGTELRLLLPAGPPRTGPGTIARSAAPGERELDEEGVRQ
jgi:two-component system NarL family sensor kinase